MWLLHLYLTFGESTSKASTWSACMVGLRTGTRARVKPQARATLDVAVVVTDRVCRICVLARLSTYLTSDFLSGPCFLA